MASNCEEPPRKKPRVLPPPQPGITELSTSGFITKLSLFDGPKVKITVGPTSQCYYLPKALLCHFSPFFKAAFEGGFREAAEQSLDMPDDHPKTFEYLIQYMVSGIHTASRNIRGMSLETIIDFFMLADKIGITDCGDLRIMLEYRIQELLETRHARNPGMLLLHSKIITPKIVRLAFQLPEGHCVRKAVADYTVLEFVSSAIEGKPFALRKEVEEVEGYGSDLAKAMVAGKLAPAYQVGNGLVHMEIRKKKSN